MSRYKKSVRQQGYGYSYGGKNSLDSEETRAISSWERLRAGHKITNFEAKNMIQFLAHVPKIKKQEAYVLSDFGLPEAAKSYDWMQMLRGIQPEEREYLRSCLRNGERFFSDPRIAISTIHQSKGGEADNVVLMTDMGRLSWENSHRDEENRVWYVALTRTRENLFIIRPRGLRHYEI